MNRGTRLRQHSLDSGRLPQVMLVTSTVAASWLGMQAIHEFGHVLGGWITGGEIERVVLHPLTISRTDFVTNPHPLIAVWAGPVVGVLVPLSLWGIAVSLKLTGAFVLRFFAGFCCVANGLYISLGSVDGVGDCGVLLQHGAATWHLWLFGVVTTPLGLWMWHQQGQHFGLGTANGVVNRGTTYTSFAVFLILFITGVLIGGE